jgi:hypothetical protein
MPNFKKDRSKFTMKGFSPFNMGTPYKNVSKTPYGEESAAFQKKDETIPEKIARLRREGKNKQADKLQKKMDKTYAKADWDKE